MWSWAEGMRDYFIRCRPASGSAQTHMPSPAGTAFGRNERGVAEPRSDALVFFGATGDLAYEQIFPALRALAGRGELDMPVIGVAKDPWTLDQLRARARESITVHGGVRDEAFAMLSG